MKHCVPVAKFGKCELSVDGILFCYRTQGGDWYLCNDSETESLTARVTFHRSSYPIPISTRVVTQQNAAGEWEATVSLLPLECTPFVAGRVKTFGINLETSPAPQAYFDSIAMQARMKCEDELYTMQKYVKYTTCTNHLERYMLERDLLSDCVQTGMPYVDVHFPPDDSSLHRNDDLDSRFIHHKGSLYWQRATDFVAPAQRNSVRVYGPSSISPSNVNQGMVGNCWFIAGLAALAEHPESVRRMFASPVIATYGVEDEHAVGGYHVTLNYNGWWVTTIVDDYFPRNSATSQRLFCNRWYFARCPKDKRDLWVPLIEKAYAKLHGSYAALKAGNATDAVLDLTGSAVYRLWALWQRALKNEIVSDTLFRLLHAAQKQRYLVCLVSPLNWSDSEVAKSAGVSSNDDMKKLYNRAGVQPRHVYTVVDARLFPLSNVRMLKLRNPTGCNITWNGDWSCGSELWDMNPQIKLSCQSERDEEKETFWMEWKDVQRYLHGGCICFLQPTWYDYRVRGMFAGTIPQVVLEVSVQKPTQVFVSLQQMGQRGMDKKNSNYAYKGIALWITQSTNTSSLGSAQSYCSTNILDSIGGLSTFTYGSHRSTSAWATLTPEHSPYYIIPRCSEPRTLLSIRSRYVLSVNSERGVGPDMKIDFKKLDMDCPVFSSSARQFSIRSPQAQYALYQRRKPGETLPETCWGNGCDDGKVYM